MRKLFKKAILGISALALPLALAATVNATEVYDSDVIDTKLEYQVNTTGDSMRFISTMTLNGKSLNDILNIKLDFDLSKDGEETKHSNTVTQTRVYDEITDENGKAKIDGTYYAVFKITELTKNYTGWRITPKFTYNYVDGSTDEVFASSWLIGGKRVYFTNSYNWDNVYAFLYKDGVDSNGTWPGETMTSYDSEHGVYYIDYPSDKPYDSIIFSNNNGRQTEDLSLDSTIHSYSLGKLSVIGDQKKYEGLGSTCSTHTWSSDYVSDGATHYHVCEVCGAKSKITDNDMEPIAGEPGVYKDKYSTYRGTEDPGYIYVQDSYYGSTQINIHYWGGTTTAGTEWAGIPLNTNYDYYFTTDMYGRNIYKVNIGDSTGFLLNNGGNGKQTADLDPSNGNAIWLGNDWHSGYYNICENEA